MFRVVLRLVAAVGAGEAVVIQVEIAYAERRLHVPMLREQPLVAVADAYARAPSLPALRGWGNLPWRWRFKNQYVDYGEGLLLYSKNHKQYSRFGINFIINSLVDKLKLEYPNYFKENYHPHSFRHSKATHLYNNGTPLLYIKDFLGHSTITTTEIYATPDSKKQRELILENAQEIKVKTNYSDNKKETLDNWLKNNMK